MVDLAKLQNVVREKYNPSFDYFYGAYYPWTPFTKELKDAKVALITTGGLHLQKDRPFDLINELTGDPTYRVIPAHTPMSDLMITHGHYDQSQTEKDLNTMLPLERLAELKQEGVIGEVAPYHYSFRGYLPDYKPLMEVYAPQVALQLQEAQVDAAVLTPA